MALRILPFRQYNETDVVNLYASDKANDKVTHHGLGDAGVFVAVSAGNLGGNNLDGPVAYETNAYLGNTDYPFLGNSDLPVVQTKVTPAATGNDVLGVTLAQTAQHDENGEKLIYYPQKQLELQAVHSGQAVPVLTKGVITLSTGAFDGTIPPPGSNVVTISPNGNGRLSGHNSLTAKNTTSTFGGNLSAGDGANIPVVGTVIATGNRVNRGLASDQFAGATVGTGAANGDGQYAVVRIS